MIQCPSTNTAVSNAAPILSSLCVHPMTRSGVPSASVGVCGASYRCSRCPARTRRVLGPCRCRDPLRGGRAVRPATPAVAVDATDRTGTKTRSDGRTVRRSDGTTVRRFDGATVGRKPSNRIRLADGPSVLYRVRMRRKTGNLKA